MAHESSPLRMLRHASEVARARSYVHQLCIDLPRQTRELAVLLTSEVVTNAVQHGLGPIELKLAASEGTVWVTVSDSGPGGPQLRRDATDRDRGRGLMVVDALSADWGVTPHRSSQGKTVWFTLATI